MKTNFTRARRKLLSLIDDDHPPRHNEVRNGCENLDLVLEAALRIMESLSQEYSRRGDRYNRNKVCREMEQLESEFTEAQNRAQEYLDKTKSESSTSESVLRTVPTIVIAHTFCASPDTRISYRQCLLIQGSFCAF